jgi:hypothetical protein
MKRYSLIFDKKSKKKEKGVTFMSSNQTIINVMPFKPAVRAHMRKIGIVFLILGILCGLAFYTAQSIALKYEEHGLFNPRSYQEDWGRDGKICLIMLIASGVLLYLSIASAVIIIYEYNKGKQTTFINLAEKKMKNYKKQVVSYETILSVSSHVKNHALKSGSVNIQVLCMKVNNKTVNFYVEHVEFEFLENPLQVAETLMAHTWQPCLN